MSMLNSVYVILNSEMCLFFQIFRIIQLLLVLKVQIYLLIIIIFSFENGVNIMHFSGLYENIFKK